MAHRCAWAHAAPGVLAVAARRVVVCLDRRAAQAEMLDFRLTPLEQILQVGARMLWLYVCMHVDACMHVCTYVSM